MKKAVVLLFDEVEEVEFVTPVDYLRRAGIEVTVAGVGSLEARGRSGIGLKADALLSEVKDLGDCLVVPGGPGSRQAGAEPAVQAAVRRQFRGGKLLAAICAAPVVVLGVAGILEGRRYTCFPGMEAEAAAGRHVAERVVVDGPLITSRAAGTAGEFALAIIAQLLGKAAADKIASDVLLS